MNLSEFYEAVVEPTIRSDSNLFFIYRSVVHQFIEAFGDLPLSEFPAVDFNAWRGELEKRVSRRTSSKYATIMRRIARQAAALGYCDSVPAAITRDRQRDFEIPPEEWEPRQITWADVKTGTSLAVVWVNCFPPKSAETDRQTRLCIRDIAEALMRSPSVGDLTTANLMQLRERLVGLKQKRSTIARRETSFRMLQRTLAHVGAEPIRKPEKHIKKPRGVRKIFGYRGPIDLGERTEGSIAWFWREYYLPLKLRAPKEATVRNFKNALRHFAAYFGRVPMLTDLDDLTVNKFLMARAEAGVSPRTINCARDRLCAIWNFAAKKGMVPEFPTVPPEKQPRRAPLAWKKDEMLRLMEACRNAKGRIGLISAADWWTALVCLVWCTGERITAIQQARWDWISGDWITIPAEARKGETGDIVRQLSAETIQSLERIREPQRDEILPFPYHRTLLWRRYKTDVLIPAGLPHDRYSSFHRLRKSVASHFQAAGHSATAVLDHSDGRVTAKYLDPRIVQTAQPADVLFSLTELPTIGEAARTAELRKGGAS